MGPSVYHWFQDSCPTLSPGDPAVAEHRRAHRGGTQRWHHTNQWKWKIFRQLRLSCCVWKAQVIHILLNTLNWNLGFICCWCNNEPEGWGEEEMRRDERKPLTNEERDRHTPFFNLQVHLLTLNLFVLFMAIVALNQELKLRLNQRTQVCCLFQWRLHHDRCCVGDASLMWRTAASCNKVWCFLATFLHPWPSMMTHAFAIAFTQLPLNSFCNVLAGFISKGDFLKKIQITQYDELVSGISPVLMELSQWQQTFVHWCFYSVESKELWGPGALFPFHPQPFDSTPLSKT